MNTSLIHWHSCENSHYINNYTKHIPLLFTVSCSGKNAFHCKRGICLSPSVLCDKRNDCVDKSDEIHCSELVLRCCFLLLLHFWYVLCICNGKHIVYNKRFDINQTVNTIHNYKIDYKMSCITVKLLRERFMKNQLLYQHF